MTTSASVGVVVVAAGAGIRLGSETPKAFVPVVGRTVLERALEPIFGMSEPAQVVVVVPEDRLTQAQDLVRRSAGPAVEFVTVIVGGATRQASVSAGLAALWPDVGIALVHDAARPFTPTGLFEAVVERVRATGEGVIPGLPVADTLKRTVDEVASETVDRSTLTAIQTPQGFPRATLIDAYALAAQDYTDDAALFAAAGHTVRVIAGDPHSFKITTPWDLRRAEQLAQPESAGTAHGNRDRRPRPRRVGPALARGAVLAGGARSRRSQRRRRALARDLRRPALGGRARRPRQPVRHERSALRGRPRGGIPSRDGRAGDRRGVPHPERRGAAGRGAAAAGRAAHGTREPAQRAGRGTRERVRDHDRRPRLHRARRGHCRRSDGAARLPGFRCAVNSLGDHPAL